MLPYEAAPRNPSTSDVRKGPYAISARVAGLCRCAPDVSASLPRRKTAEYQMSSGETVSGDSRTPKSHSILASGCFERGLQAGAAAPGFGVDMHEHKSWETDPGGLRIVTPHLILAPECFECGLQAGAAARGCGADTHEHQPGAHDLQDGPDARLVWLPGALLWLERPRRAEAAGVHRPGHVSRCWATPGTALAMQASQQKHCEG